MGERKTEAEREGEEEVERQRQRGRGRLGKTLQIFVKGLGIYRDIKVRKINI